MAADPGKLETSIGYSFEDRNLLGQALTHRSVGKIHNERMEFLGDAILDMVIAERLFAKFPAAAEGDLSRMRANLVNGQVLAEIAIEIGLGQYLNLGTGELKSGGKRRDSILADAIEALIAAVYLEGGLTDDEAVIERFYADRLEAKEICKRHKDSKTRLQEFMQARGLPLPNYCVTDISGEAHDQTFTVDCQVVLLSQSRSGTGKSKRIAEQKAADRILTILESQ